MCSLPSTPLDQPAVWVHRFLPWRPAALCPKPLPKVVIVLELFWKGTFVLGFQLSQTYCTNRVSPSQWQRWLWQTALFPLTQGTKGKQGPVQGQLFYFSHLVVALGYRRFYAPQGFTGFSLPNSSIFRRLKLAYWGASEGVPGAEIAPFTRVQGEYFVYPQEQKMN